MSFLFTSIAGRRNPTKTLSVDVYVHRLDQGLLTPNTKALGFKTYVAEEPSSPFLLDEERYIAQFRAHWAAALEEVAIQFGVTVKDLRSVMSLTDGEDVAPAAEGVALGTHEEASAISEQPDLELATAIILTGPDTTASDSTTPPAIEVAGASPASEEASAPVSRTKRKHTVLKALRAPPLTHEWGFWHDRQVSSAENAGGAKYESRLKKLIEMNNVQTFWETFNNFPLDKLILRDSVYLFKRAVKPVWEDPRNARGGSWTFRVSKENSAAMWMHIQMMAIGELLQEVVEAHDDICGVGLSIRFGSDLVSVWNRDASNQKSVDAILAVVLDQLPDELKPTKANYYYKKHSEHKGFTLPATSG